MHAQSLFPPEEVTMPPVQKRLDIEPIANVPLTAASAVAPVPSIACVFEDPADNQYRTDETFFFGLRRRAPSAFTPAAHEVGDYIYDPKNEDRMRGVADRDNVLMIGPPGCGKTLSAKWFAHNLGCDFYLGSFNAHTQADDLLVTPLQDPNTGYWKHIPSTLVQAYWHGGVYCGDEILALKPGPLQVLHPFLNGDTITIATPDGPVRVPRHPDFRFFGTANHWANTRGNNVIGEALMDRCMVVTMDYISEELEIQALLQAAPDAAPGFVADLVRWAATVRNGVRTNPERNHYIPSTRMLARLVRHIARGRADVATACNTMIFEPIRVRYPDELKAVRDVFENIVPV